MVEDIKGLIEKINEEGVQAAQAKAKEIEEQAQAKAKTIIKQAEEEAQKIISQVRESGAKEQAAMQALLKQAGRDLLLALRKEISAMLDKVVVSRIQQALSPQELIKIINGLIKDYKGKEKDGIVITLNNSDLAKLEKEFLRELKEIAKEGIVLKPSEDISGGLIISYDSNKSHYDFTDKAIAEYIGFNLKPKLKELFHDLEPDTKKATKK